MSLIFHEIRFLIDIMFSDRINPSTICRHRPGLSTGTYGAGWIDLIFFHGFHLPVTLSLARRAGMKPRKRDSASAEKRAEE
jgi:hypothetical protein